MRFTIHHEGHEVGRRIWPQSAPRGEATTKGKKRFTHKEHKGYKLWDGYSRPFRMN